MRARGGPDCVTISKEATRMSSHWNLDQLVEKVGNGICTTLWHFWFLTLRKGQPPVTLCHMEIKSVISSKVSVYHLLQLWLRVRLRLNSLKIVNKHISIKNDNNHRNNDNNNSSNSKIWILLSPRLLALAEKGKLPRSARQTHHCLTWRWHQKGWQTMMKCTASAWFLKWKH